MIERVSGAFQAARPALYIQPTERADGEFAEAGQAVEMEVDVVGDHQVDEAVVVVVAEGRAGGIAIVAHAGFGRDVGKCAVAIVAIEDIRAQAGDVEIGPAIIVIVTHRATIGETGCGDSGLVSHIGKRAIVVVVVKSAARFLMLQSHFHGGSVGEVEVGPAVTIVVDEQDPAAHRLRNVFLLWRISVPELNSRLLGNIFQLWNRSAGANHLLESRGGRWSGIVSCLR